MNIEIIVIGAGASGLAAAYELSLVNKKVLVLEARDRLGGRIQTVYNPLFAEKFEAGAEFIHGKLPVTLTLLKKAGIKHYKAGGKTWNVKNGNVQKGQEQILEWKRVMKKLKELKNDLPIANFLNQNFGGEENKELRQSVVQFVEGYDAADAHKASSFALKEEWEKVDDEQQMRITGGYGTLINYLAEEIKKRGNKILFQHVVKNILWQKGKAEVVTTSGKRFIAAKILTTIPLGIWQAEGLQGCINYTPEVKEKKEAAKQMGFGAVIKFNFQFENQFWEEEIPGKIKNAGFIFSDGAVPTWWTQQPKKNGMLTGWIAGPKASGLKNCSNGELFEIALTTLAYIFGVNKNFLQKKLVAHHISNWAADAYTLGAYSYETLNTKQAKKILARPIEQTLYFAGEALFEGTATGTVEAALANGIEVSENMIADENS